MSNYEATQEFKNGVKNYYNVTDKEIERDKKIIKEWCGNQQHLPHIQDDDLYERFLLLNKFNVERTKQKIDAYYSLKHQYKNFFLNIKLSNPSEDVMQCIVLPNPTHNYERVCIFRLVNPDINQFSFYRTIKRSILNSEIALRTDYTIGVIIIFDFIHCSINHVMKITPSMVKDILNIYQNVYSSRIAGIHYVNIPTYVLPVLNVVKNALKNKISERIKVHDKVEDLCDYLPRESLPNEYGGIAGTIKEIMSEWDEFVQQHQPNLQVWTETTSNENLRICPITYENELIGINGTFKKLEID